MWDTCTSHFGPKKFDRVGRGGQGRSKYGTFGSLQWEMCTNALFWPSLTPPATPVKFFWSKMACTGVPHIVLHVSCWTRTSRGYFGPLRSDLRVFWPFWGTDFIMGKNQNGIFSQGARQEILIFSLSSLFKGVLKVPEEKLAVHNFWSWVLSGGSVAIVVYFLNSARWLSSEACFLYSWQRRRRLCGKIVDKYFWRHIKYHYLM